MKQAKQIGDYILYAKLKKKKSCRIRFLKKVTLFSAFFYKIS